ncbi:MAG: DsbA family protein [Hyphomicrobiaceae bacterium]
MSEEAKKHCTAALSRRRVVVGLAALGSTIGIASYFALNPSGGPSAALAQRKTDATEFPIEELMKTGTLEERVLGKSDAPNTIIEYASMTCGHCGNFHRSIYPELKEKLVDTGKALFIFREFPLDNYAAAASMLARCVAPDKFFNFVDVLFKQQDSWAYVDPSKRVETLMGLAKQVGFNKEKFEKCLTDQKLLDGINWVRERANEEFGVNSTPTFFVNGKLLRGGNDLEEFEKLMAP